MSWPVCKLTDLCWFVAQIVRIAEKLAKNIKFGCECYCRIIAVVRVFAKCWVMFAVWQCWAVSRATFLVVTLQTRVLTSVWLQRLLTVAIGCLWKTLVKKDILLTFAVLWSRNVKISSSRRMPLRVSLMVRVRVRFSVQVLLSLQGTPLMLCSHTTMMTIDQYL